MRWQNPESLHIYARWDLDEYEKWIRRSRRQTLVAREAVNIPVIDPGAALHNFRGLLQRLEVPRFARRFDKNPELTVRAPRFRAAAGEERVRLRGGGGDGNAGAVDLRLPCPFNNCTPDLRPKGKIPPGFVARRQHARGKCYWVYMHPRLGRYESIPRALAALAAHGLTGNDGPPQRARTNSTTGLARARKQSPPDHNSSGTVALDSGPSSAEVSTRRKRAAVAPRAVHGIAKRRRKRSIFAVLARTKPTNLLLRALTKRRSVSATKRRSVSACP